MGTLARALLSILLLALLLAQAGCATMEANSDQPWGMQESWEGSVTLPGFSGN
ncbi:MAG: hypothetical protein ACOX5G_05710 [Kiritimatiellia bacterium]|jgi:hypothetical protein